MSTFLVTLSPTLRLIVSLLGCTGLLACFLFVRDLHAGEKCPDGTCSILGKSPYAHLIAGTPNWYFGIPFYLLTVLAGVLNLPLLTLLVEVGSLTSVIVSCILVWALVVRLKTFCRYCYMSHAVNLGIFITLLLAIRYY